MRTNLKVYLHLTRITKKSFNHCLASLLHVRTTLVTYFCQKQIRPLANNHISHKFTINKEISSLWGRQHSSASFVKYKTKCQNTDNIAQQVLSKTKSSQEYEIRTLLCQKERKMSKHRKHCSTSFVKNKGKFQNRDNIAGQVLSKTKSTQDDKIRTLLCQVSVLHRKLCNTSFIHKHFLV